MVGFFRFLWVYKDYLNCTKIHLDVPSFPGFFGNLLGEIQIIASLKF